MLKFAKLAAFLAASIFLAAPAFSQDKSAAKVNGSSIPQSRVEMQVKELTRQGQPDSPELRKAMLERLINIELVAQEATKKGLDKQPEFQDQIEMIRQSILAQAFVEDYKKNHPISDDTLKQEYEKLKDQPNNLEYSVSHILVKSEKEAHAIAAKLKQGGNFAAIAKKSSTDPAAKQNGGSMGWHVPADFEQPFAEAMMSMKKGQISEPVQTQYGWHVVKIDDTRVIPFEKVKPNLIEMLQGRAVQKLIQDLRKNAKIENGQ